MGTRANEHWIDLEKTPGEKILDFLLRNSDTVRLTRVEGRNFGFFRLEKFAHDEDPKFKETLTCLRPEFIRKTVTNRRYGEITQFKDSRFRHYYFRLSKRMRALLKKEKMSGLFIRYMPDSKNELYGFEDPTFYKKGKLLSVIISHEPMVSLHVSEKKRNELETKGFVFFKTE